MSGYVKVTLSPSHTHTHTLTSIFAHDGSLDVIRSTLPHTDGFGVLGVHGASFLVEAVVPGGPNQDVIQGKATGGWYIGI